MSLLSEQNLAEAKLTDVKHSQQLPIKVLQIGEGNFLRGFADWMLHEAINKGLFHGSVAVTQPRVSGKKKIDELKEQNGMYTLVIRGIEDGQQVEKTEIISVFSQIINPYEQWDSFMRLASEPELRFVISNTTEAGLVYSEEKWIDQQPIHSFPGKLTALLYKRFKAFQGATDKGLICLPCELLERNGDTLKQLVFEYANAWHLPQAFIDWIAQHNKFLNSLVDRIVTGYPAQEQAKAWFTKWGYEDKQLTTAEPYHLWVIEGEQAIANELPLAEAGLNVLWVEDLKPYQQRKVAILNGAHTSLALLGMLKGEQEVKLAMNSRELSSYIKEMIKHEIIPTLPYEKTELELYAEQVYERFMNPFIEHRLADIAMNSLSKFKTRLFPAIEFYLKRDGALPDGLLTSFASLVRHYKVSKTDAGYVGKTFSKEPFVIRDDAKMLESLAAIWLQYEHHLDLTLTIRQILSDISWWGHDLVELYPAFPLQLAKKLMEME